MSLLQDQDFVLYRIRNRYLQYMRDGVGERLITLNPTALNVPAFRNAGWGCPSEIRRTYSPPIPVGRSADYLPVRTPQNVRDSSAGAAPAPANSGGVIDDFRGRSFAGGLVPGFRNESAGEGKGKKARREIHRDREDDSSEMSEDTEEEEGGTLTRHTPPRPTQFNFAKKELPLRPRSGSSPLRSGPQFPSASITRSRATRRFRGSHGDADFHKTRAGSLPAASEGLLSSGFIFPSELLHAEIADKLRSSPSTSSIPRNDSFGDDDSDGGSLDSDFTEIAETNLEEIPEQVPAVLHALPPPIRPISQIQPTSVLTQLLRAKELEVENPMEEYQQYSGQGELTPITLKLYIPYSKSSTPFEVIIKRLPKQDSFDTTVAQAIGFALYKYIEEKKAPALADEQCDINHWVLRMVDDGEPDEDFPPLERNKPITTYIAQGGRRVGRGGAGGRVVKLEGEFALVEATTEQYIENERATPNKTPRKPQIAVPIPSTAIIPPTPLTPQATSQPFAPDQPQSPPPPTASAANNSTTPVLDSSSKILRIHISTIDEFAQSISICVTLSTPLSAVLSQVCRKKSLSPAHHILRITGAPPLAIVPLHQPVSSLGSRVELDLVRNPSCPPPPPPQRTSTAAAPAAPPAPSRILRPSEEFPPPEFDYQRFTVYRKSTTPMSLLSRHERILAIDGEFLHVQSPRKTKTIHISTIIGCKTHRRQGASFKILVWRGGMGGAGGAGGGGKGGGKRFDFEAGSGEVAEEVVMAVKKAMDAFEGAE